MSADRPFGAAGSPDTSTPASNAEHPRIGELVATLSTQFSTLIRGEIALTKTKALAFGKKVGAGAAFLISAALLGLYLLGWVFHTIEVAITLALPQWAAALITAGILLALIIILVLLGINAMKRAQNDTPTPQEGVKKDVNAVKKGLDK